jgi:hypothetical protein
LLNIENQKKVTQILQWSMACCMYVVEKISSWEDILRSNWIWDLGATNWGKNFAVLFWKTHSKGENRFPLGANGITGVGKKICRAL